MTTVSLKLVGYPNDKIIKINKDKITILDIYSYLVDNEMLFNEISEIMFINNGINIKNDTSRLFEGTDDYPLNIHMFTNNPKIKNEIINHIYNKGTDNIIMVSSEEPDEPFMDANETHIDTHNDTHNDTHYDYEEISQEEINKNNEKIVELFSDNDFVYLLNIFIKKPELINKVASYVSNGNIINTKMKEIDGEFKYTNELAQIIELLTKLNKEYDESELKSIINNFEGNLNLSLRYILNK